MPLSESEINALLGSGFVPHFEPPVAKRKKPRFVRCRFFAGPRTRFILEPPPQSLTEKAHADHLKAERARKRQQQDMKLEHALPAKAKTQFLDKLADRQSRIRDFFLFDVATFDLASDSAFEILKAQLADLTGSSVEEVNVKRVQAATQHMMELHAIHKLADILGVDPVVTAKVMTSMEAQSNGQQELSKLLALSRLQGSGQVPNVPLPQVGPSRSKLTSGGPDGRNRSPAPVGRPGG